MKSNTCRQARRAPRISSPPEYEDYADAALTLGGNLSPPALLDDLVDEDLSPSNRTE